VNLFPGNLLDQLVDIAIVAFIASAALYGAVLLIQAIWIWLISGVAVFASIAIAVWIARMRFGRW